MDARRYHDDKPVEMGYAANISGSAQVNSTTQSKRAQPAAGNHYGAQRGKRYGDGKN